jgi:3-methyladenine DNA glycosylase Tag
MIDAMNKKILSFWWKAYLDIEIERFSEEEIEDLKSCKSIIKNTEKIKNIIQDVKIDENDIKIIEKHKKSLNRWKWVDAKTFLNWL